MPGLINMPLIGYARVSTDAQSYQDQLGKLEAAGAARIFREKDSGARGDRPQLAKAIASLEAGDVLLVTRLDRLARSTRDLLNIVHAIGERGAAFKSLSDTWADTANAHGRLMMTILARLAELERELIRARTSAGRERAKAQGVRFGRKLKLSAHQRTHVLKLLDNGETQSAVAKLLGVDQSTISRLVLRSAA
jgi:DNA invertase Pin-like site-specific DNA recombinase